MAEQSQDMAEIERVASAALLENSLLEANNLELDLLNATERAATCHIPVIRSILNARVNHKKAHLSAFLEDAEVLAEKAHPTLY